MRRGTGVTEGILSKDKWPEVTLLDIAVLLFNVHKAAANKRIGFEDANRTIEDITVFLNKKTRIDPDALESALWSSNLLDERKAFWHPFKKPFEAWVKDMLPGKKFNRTYNLVLEEEKND